jgi:hypothetical protein
VFLLVCFEQQSYNFYRNSLVLPELYRRPINPVTTVQVYRFAGTAGVL